MRNLCNLNKKYLAFRTNYCDVIWPEYQVNIGQNIRLTAFVT